MTHRDADGVPDEGIAHMSEEMGQQPEEQDGTDMELYDLRVTVESIEGRSVCGMQVGDYFELVNSAELRLPAGRHFCVYALQAALPLLPAKQRQLPENDWMEKDALVCCPDPDERLIMCIERTRRVRMRSSDLM